MYLHESPVMGDSLFHPGCADKEIRDAEMLMPEIDWNPLRRLFGLDQLQGLDYTP